MPPLGKPDGGFFMFGMLSCPMTNPDWIAATRRALTAHPAPADPWSDMDMERYHREGFSPEGAAAELAARDAASR